jgi:hypothetical protein
VVLRWRVVPQLEALVQPGREQQVLGPAPLAQEVA